MLCVSDAACILAAQRRGEEFPGVREPRSVLLDLGRSSGVVCGTGPCKETAGCRFPSGCPCCPCAIIQVTISPGTVTLERSKGDQYGWQFYQRAHHSPQASHGRHPIGSRMYYPSNVFSMHPEATQLLNYSSLEHDEAVRTMNKASAPIQDNCTITGLSLSPPCRQKVNMSCVDTNASKSRAMLALQARRQHGVTIPHVGRDTPGACICRTG